MADTRLLHGPYSPPPLKRGDRANCLYRDCEVVITSWSDARISWPRCRAVGPSGSGSGLLLDAELARAIRTESAAAVMYRWGVGVHAVWNWRQALGVTKTNNEGTNRLVRQAAKQGAAAVKRRVFTAAERVAKRRTALRLNLGRNLITGYHGSRWTWRQLAMLGNAPDVEVAQRINRTTTAVRVMRTRLGISKADDRRSAKRNR